MKVDVHPPRMISIIFGIHMVDSGQECDSYWGYFTSILGGVIDLFGKYSGRAGISAAILRVRTGGKIRSTLLHTSLDSLQ